MKPKKQFNYYFIWIIIITTMCVVNSIYYVFYTSFASFSLLAELGLVGEVGDSVTEKLRLVDFIYLLAPAFYIIMHTKLKKGSYYHFVAKVENGSKMFSSTLLAGVAVLSLTLVNNDSIKVVKDNDSRKRYIEYDLRGKRYKSCNLVGNTIDELLRCKNRLLVIEFLDTRYEIALTLTDSTLVSKYL